MQLTDLIWASQNAFTVTFDSIIKLEKMIYKTKQLFIFTVLKDDPTSFLNFKSFIVSATLISSNN